MNCIHMGIPSPLSVKEKSCIYIRLDFNATLFKINISPSFQPSTFSFIHSSAFGWQLQQAQQDISIMSLPGNTLRLVPGAPAEVKEPSSEFWIHPRAFLSIGYTLTTSKRDALGWHLIQIQDPLQPGHSTPSSALQMSRSLAHLSIAVNAPPPTAAAPFM